MDYSHLYSGEHLKKINPSWTYKKWSYRYTFEAKMHYILNLLDSLAKDTKILDAGCGQGLLVEEFHSRGYDIKGIDAFYSSELVRKDDLLKNGFADNTFDVILCLDVIEHFPLQEQEGVVQELTRILKPSVKLIFSIPNKKHLTARIFFFIPQLSRTAKPEYHPGDRGITEYLPILGKYLQIETKKGLSPTIPFLFQVTQLFPQYTTWLYRLLKPFSVFYGWGFNVIFF